MFKIQQSNQSAVMATLTAKAKALRTLDIQVPTGLDYYTVLTTLNVLVKSGKVRMTSAREWSLV